MTNDSIVQEIHNVRQRILLEECDGRLDKLIARWKNAEWYRAEGLDGLTDRSRRPQRLPRRTPADVEQSVLDVRQEHPAWGGRKIGACLRRKGQAAPAASTITAILHRHERIDPQESSKYRAFRRFERPAPNDLWQMDFKGHFALENGERVLAAAGGLADPPGHPRDSRPPPPPADAGQR